MAKAAKKQDAVQAPTSNESESPVTAAQRKTMDDLPTKSARIRYLNTEGFTRSQIAKALNIRYQHVRNVLITPLAKDAS